MPLNTGLLWLQWIPVRMRHVCLLLMTRGHMPLRLLRVETARDQLITMVLPLKAIAGATGFCDEYHLSRVFRKHFQVPPGYFRK